MFELMITCVTSIILQGLFYQFVRIFNGTFHILDASGMIKFWHYTSNKCIQTINEGRQTLASCFNPTGTKILTAGADPQINAYDVATKKKIMSYEPR